jgi:hypothetical protein
MLCPTVALFVVTKKCYVFKTLEEYNMTVRAVNVPSLALAGRFHR